MYHRPTTRVLAVLELLQTHKRINGSELAERLKVNVRTVRRYIAILEDIGIPILAEQGRDGGYRLVSGFKLPPMMFTDEEAIALSLGLLAARELGVAETVPAVDSAQAKLERVMPEPIKRRLHDINDTVQLDFSTPWASASNESLGELTIAAHARQRVHLEYVSPSGEASSRDFDPYGLSYRRGRWYAVGFCHLRQDLRTFRLDRMRRILKLDRHFERPDGFDVVDYLARSFASIPRAHSVEVLLLTDLATARNERVGPVELLEPCDDGVLLRTSTDSLDFFARHLACLPFDFQIRNPPELSIAVGNLIERLHRSATAFMNDSSKEYTRGNTTREG
jgi:predicted DNA-binding transcriptional regulator YafY